MKNNIRHGTNFLASLDEMMPIIQEALQDGGEFRMITAGTSMLPLLRNRKDTVVLKLPAVPLKRYDIPLYCRENGQYVLHRIIRCKNGTYDMCGDNQTLIEKSVPNERIVACVDRIIRGGKEIDLKSSFSYKLYVFFWCRCFFLRVIAFKLRSVILRLRKIFNFSERK